MGLRPAHVHLRPCRGGVSCHANQHRTPYLYRHIRRRDHAGQRRVSDGLWQIDQLQRSGQPTADHARKRVLAGGCPGQAPQRVGPTHQVPHDPSLFADRRQSAEGQYRLHAATAHLGYDRHDDGRLFAADPVDGGILADPPVGVGWDGRRRCVLLGELQSQKTHRNDRGTTARRGGVDGALAARGAPVCLGHQHGCERGGRSAWLGTGHHCR